MATRLPRVTAACRPGIRTVGLMLSAGGRQLGAAPLRTRWWECCRGETLPRPKPGGANGATKVCGGVAEVNKVCSAVAGRDICFRPSALLYCGVPTTDAARLRAGANDPAEPVPIRQVPSKRGLRAVPEAPPPPAEGIRSSSLRVPGRGPAVRPELRATRERREGRVPGFPRSVPAVPHPLRRCRRLRPRRSVFLRDPATSRRTGSERKLPTQRTPTRIRLLGWTAAGVRIAETSSAKQLMKRRPRIRPVASFATPISSSRPANH
jgi:hypothetical protein